MCDILRVYVRQRLRGAPVPRVACTVVVPASVAALGGASESDDSAAPVGARAAQRVRRDSIFNMMQLKSHHLQIRVQNDHTQRTAAAPPPRERRTRRRLSHLDHQATASTSAVASRPILPVPRLRRATRSNLTGAACKHPERHWPAAPNAVADVADNGVQQRHPSGRRRGHGAARPRKRRATSPVRDYSTPCSVWCRAGRRKYPFWTLQ